MTAPTHSEHSEPTNQREPQNQDSKNPETAVELREATGLAAPLLRFRISAWVTGVGLLGLCLVMILRYVAKMPGPSAVYSPIHGVLYMVYLVVTIDLAIKARWAIKRTVLVLLAGCVPLVSFFVERRVAERVKAGLKF